VRVALDTNVLASAIGTRGLCADVLRTVLLEHELVIGEFVLLELRRNLAKKFRLTPDVIAEFAALLRTQAQVGPTASALDIAGVDANDGRVLAEAIAANAELFVTGDGQLQALGDRAPLPILSPRQFWELLRRRG
jgi:putative PIN family toxin of toxin-antitoxin system